MKKGDGLSCQNERTDFGAEHRPEPGRDAVPRPGSPEFRFGQGVPFAGAGPDRGFSPNPLSFNRKLRKMKKKTDA